jgi:GT2 family glycosyltransferase
VVENSNDQLLKEEILSRYNNVDCVLSKENLGYGAGNNLGLSKVETNYALIVNPDVTLKNNAIKQFFLRTNKVENFGIIAPVSKDEKYNNFDIDLDKDIKEVENVKGFAMFLNMKNLKKINFFDENFFLYFEEIDLCKRLQNNNIKIYIDPLIEVSHFGGTSHNTEINKPMELSRNWHWMWSSFYYYKKHHGYITALIRIFPKLISSSIKFAVYLLIFKRFKSDIYKHRVLGIINSVLLKKSWYRPKI